MSLTATLNSGKFQICKLFQTCKLIAIKIVKLRVKKKQKKQLFGQIMMNVIKSLFVNSI